MGKQVGGKKQEVFWIKMRTFKTSGSEIVLHLDLENDEMGLEIYDDGKLNGISEPINIDENTAPMYEYCGPISSSKYQSEIEKVLSAKRWEIDNAVGNLAYCIFRDTDDKDFG